MRDHGCESWSRGLDFKLRHYPAEAGNLAGETVLVALNLGFRWGDG
jgi:hypothetical protein